MLLWEACQRESWAIYLRTQGEAVRSVSDDLLMLTIPSDSYFYGRFLAVDVAHPGGHLDDRAFVRRPVLRHEHHRRIALGVEHQRQYADGTRRTGDVAGECGSVGCLELDDGEARRIWKMMGVAVTVSVSVAVARGGRARERVACRTTGVGRSMVVDWRPGQARQMVAGDLDHAKVRVAADRRHGDQPVDHFERGARGRGR